MTYVNYPTKPCVHCKKTSIVQLWDDDLERYMNGALIQDAFPDLMPPVREQIQSGIHPQCWNELFKDEDEDD